MIRLRARVQIGGALSKPFDGFGSWDGVSRSGGASGTEGASCSGARDPCQRFGFLAGLRLLALLLELGLVMRAFLVCLSVCSVFLAG